MIDILKGIEKNLIQLLIEKSEAGKIHTMYIDYHKPYVKRIWFQHGDYRVFLHKIEQCTESAEALYHPHPWKSAVKIISGTYEMGVGHSSTEDVPKTDCKLILKPGTIYEMMESDGWHYVSPKDGDSFSLMVTGELTNRKTPVSILKKWRPLHFSEIVDILFAFGYTNITSHQVTQITNNIINNPFKV